MKFFLDTAEISEIREAQALGILDGVTTNPSLIAKAAKPFKETIIDICNVVKGPTSIEVTSLEVDDMVRDGREYAKWEPLRCYQATHHQGRRKSLQGSFR